MSKTNLLGDAKDWFTSRGVKIRKTFSDGVGDYGFQVHLEGPTGPTKLVVGAKKDAYTRADTDVGSFMRWKMVQRASDYDALLVLYLQARDQFFVFDPDAFLDHGVEPDDNSPRKERGEEWLDLPLDWAVSLEDWLAGYDAPKTELVESDPFPLFSDQLGVRSGTLDAYLNERV